MTDSDGTGTAGGAPLQKVFCIGFQKTGTTSMNAALAQLGYRVATVWGRDLDLETLRATYVSRGLEMARVHDAVEDMPWPLMFRELDAAFPGSKFILTWRETDRWIKSISDHFGPNPDVMQKLTYGPEHPHPIGHEARYAEVYDAHNAAVRAYFADRPGDILEMNLSHGDGWDKLCPFIGAENPGTEFPRSNTHKARMSLVNRARRRIGRILNRLAG